MNTKNTATPNPKATQGWRQRGYALLISAALISQGCNDTRTKSEIKADNYAERVDKKNNLTADLQHYENKLEQAKTELIAIQIQIESTKTTIQAGNHTTDNAKTLKKLSKKEHVLQEEIAELILSIQQTTTKLDATKKTVEILGKTL